MSLNRGMAEIELAPENAVTVTQIRNIVKRSGFTPKETRVEALGRVEKKGDELVLVVAKGQEYRLRPSQDAPEQLPALEKINSGKQVKVQGIIPIDMPKKPWMEVLSISVPAQKQGRDGVVE